jgi:hypothetical protein
MDGNNMAALWLVVPYGWTQPYFLFATLRGINSLFALLRFTQQGLAASSGNLFAGSSGNSLLESRALLKRKEWRLEKEKSH